MKSLPFSDARSVVERMRRSAACRSLAEILFLATSRSRFLLMVSSARSRKPCCTSHSRTSNPLLANTWAMPLPMVPAPRTPTVLISNEALAERYRIAKQKLSRSLLADRVGPPDIMKLVVDGQQIVSLGALDHHILPPAPRWQVAISVFATVGKRLAYTAAGPV